ncbi:MAG: hypothetical protein ACRDCW_17185 [Sarcina sp.]
MKVIYQEKDHPNSIGEFEILDRAQIEKLSQYTNDFLETSDKDFKISDPKVQKKTPLYSPLNQINSTNPTPFKPNNLTKPAPLNPHYQEGGIPTPLNIGYPPSKTPNYQSEGIVKFTNYTTPNAQFNNNIQYHKIRYCVYRFTYLWLHNGKAFWSYPTYINNNILSGWEWRNYKWQFFSIPIRKISNFYCYR